jgi:hypothetical protein
MTRSPRPSAPGPSSDALRPTVAERENGDVVRPLGLDRCGFRLRIEQRRGHRDVRVSCAEPVSIVDELGPAVHRLIYPPRRACPER